MMEIYAILTNDQIPRRKRRIVKVQLSEQQIRDLALMILEKKLAELSHEKSELETKKYEAERELNFIEQKQRMVKELNFIFPQWERRSS